MISVKVKKIKLGIGDVAENIGATLIVGISDNTHVASDLTIAEIAKIQEFGTKRIPPRPFLFKNIDDNLEDWFTMFKALSKRSKKINVFTNFKAIGVEAVTTIKQQLSTINSPPLAELTLKIRKWRETYGLEKVKLNKKQTATMFRELKDTPPTPKNTRFLRVTDNLIDGILSKVEMQ